MKFISDDGKMVGAEQEVRAYEIELERAKAKADAAKAAKLEADKKKKEKEKKATDNYDNDVKDLESTVKVINDIFKRNQKVKDNKILLFADGKLTVMDWNWKDYMKDMVGGFDMLKDSPILAMPMDSLDSDLKGVDDIFDCFVKMCSNPYYKK